MKVTVRFFAAPREALQCSLVQQELPAQATVGQLLKALCQRFPALTGYVESIHVAVNRQYAEVGTELHDGDEVACLPPVGGG